MAAASASAAVVVGAEDKCEGRPEPIVLSDDFKLPLDSLNVTDMYKKYLSHILLPKGFVSDRVSALAKQVAADYVGTCPHILCVLKGASVFTMKLINELHIAFSTHPKSTAGVPFTFAFCRLKSYQGTESTGTVSLSGVDDEELRGRRVLVVEDIVDTGRSMCKLLPHLRETCGVADARVCTLVEKRTPKSCGLKAWYSGFSIPDAFIVGCGLDYNEAFRDLDHICVVNEAGVVAFRDFEESLKHATSGGAKAE